MCVWERERVKVPPWDHRHSISECQYLAPSIWINVTSQHRHGLTDDFNIRLPLKAVNGAKCSVDRTSLRSREDAWHWVYDWQTNFVIIANCRLLSGKTTCTTLLAGCFTLWLWFRAETPAGKSWRYIIMMQHYSMCIGERWPSGEHLCVKVF